MTAEPAMSPEDYVDALYRLCLGREPDAEGRAAWIATVRSSGDPTVVLAELLKSDEHRQRLSAADPDYSALTDEALRRLERRPMIVDVGAQLLPDEPHPYSRLVLLTPTDILGFDPLAERIIERAAAEANSSGTITLQPYALGDGEEHTLYVANEDSTSSLFPLNVEHNRDFNHTATLHVVRTEKIQTHRLDDVVPTGPIDLLKLDVQGAELMVLRGAAASLAATAVVHCEVEFSPLYVGQPLYPEIHRELVGRGFYLVDLLPNGKYHYLNSEGIVSKDRLLWADAVFFRESDEPEVLAAQALIAAAIYSKPSLARHLLDKAARRPGDSSSLDAGRRLGTASDTTYEDAKSFRPAIFGPPERFHVHPTVVLNDALINTTSGDVTIDEYAFFGHRVMILAATHDVTKIGSDRQTAIPQVGFDIHIGRGAWIASGAIVIGPCTIGESAVIGAGSLVNSDVPAYAVAVGSPARVISRIDVDTE